MSGGWLSPLGRAEGVVANRLLNLERRLEEEPALWPEYLDTLNTYLGVLARMLPGASAMTQDELAEKFGVSPRTLRRTRRLAAAGSR